MAEAIKTTAGVQELVHRLRDEGVQAGKQEAEQILKEARDNAAAILTEANAEADKILRQAHIKNEAEKVHAQESLKIAVRDTEIELQRGLEKAFMSHVKRLVSKEVRDEEFLRQLLLTIVGPRFFGRQHLGAISGLTSSILVFASALGPFLFSAIRDINDTYHPVLILSACIPVLILIPALGLKNPQTGR